MSYLTLTQDKLAADFSGQKVWYDEANQQLLLLKKGIYSAVPFGVDGGKTKAIVEWLRDGVILDVKISLSGKFMASQRSDTLVELVPLTSGEVHNGVFKPAPESVSTLVCRPKKGNNILCGGLIWLKPSDNVTEHFMLITKYGIELHKVQICNDDKSGKSKNGKSGGQYANVKLVGVVKHTIHCFWYLPANQIIVVSTSSGKEMRPYSFENSVPVKLAKFLLPSTPLKRDMILVQLYHKPYAVHIDNVSLQLRLYSVKRDVTTCEKVLKLFAAGNFSVSVIDNLLCIHNMDTKVSLLYDIAVDTTDPIVNPTPISFSRDQPTNPSNRTIQQISIPLGTRFDLVLLSKSDTQESSIGITCPSMGMGVEKPGTLKFVDGKRIDELSMDKCRAILSSSDGAPHQVTVEVDTETKLPSQTRTVLYSESWVFLPPNWVLDARAGSLWQLNLDTECVTQCCRKENIENIAVFLLRRQCCFPLQLGRKLPPTTCYSKLVFLDYVLETLSDSQSLVHASAVFNIINEAYRSYQSEVDEDGDAHKTQTVSLDERNHRSPEPKFDEVPFECTINRWRNTYLADVVSDQTNNSKSFPVIIEPKPRIGVETLPDIRSKDHRAVVLQAELMIYVFLPLVAKQQNPSGYQWPAHLMIEYIRSLMRHGIEVQPFILLLAAALCAGSGLRNMLLHIISQGIMPDTTLLAELLIAMSAPGSSAVEDPAFQAGIDVFHRLGRLDTIVDLLLERGQVRLALGFIGKRTNTLSLESLDLAVRCFRATALEAKRVNNFALFGTLHSFILTSNPMLISRSHPSMASKTASGEPQSLLASLVELPQVNRLEEKVILVDMFGFASGTVNDTM